MNSTEHPLKAKSMAIAEATAVFILILLGFKAIQASPLGEVEYQALGRYFLEYSLVPLLPITILFLAHRSFKEYGLTLKNAGRQRQALIVGLIPVLVLSSLLFFLGWGSWKNTILVSLVEIVALFVMAWTLMKSTSIGKGYSTGVLVLLVVRLFIAAPKASIGMAAARLVYTFLFVALGEEILFRGYIQQRINQTFGRPYAFFGVGWGWGWIISSLLFGLWHVLIPCNPFIGQFALRWQWGLWTFFLGLILGFIREKTESVLVPAILHGVINF